MSSDEDKPVQRDVSSDEDKPVQPLSAEAQVTDESLPDGESDAIPRHLPSVRISCELRPGLGCVCTVVCRHDNSQLCHGAQLSVIIHCISPSRVFHLHQSMLNRRL